MGRSIREDAERSYLLHGWDTLKDLFMFNRWPWSDWWEATKEIGGFLFLIFRVITFPVMVPIAAIMRKRYAVRSLQKWERIKEKTMS